MVFGVSVEMSALQTGIRQSSGRDSVPEDWMRLPRERVETENAA